MARPGIEGGLAVADREFVVFEPDGKAANKVNGFRGSWEFVSTEGGTRNYKIVWPEVGWIDSVKVEEARGHLTGENHEGYKVYGWKVEPGDDPIVGAWLWNTDLTSVFRDDGTVMKAKDTGRWKLTSSSRTGRNYKIEWESGWSDDFTMTPDGKSFSGSNNHGGPVSAKKLE